MFARVLWCGTEQEGCLSEIAMCLQAESVAAQSRMQQAQAQADDLHQQLEARQAAAEAAAEAKQEVKALKQVSMSVAYKCSRR